MESRVRYELAGGVATITLDDGKVNALGLPMLADINDALDRAAAEAAVVILTGNARLFSGGFDLKTFKAGGADLVTMLTKGGDLGERLLTFPKPVVIAASGHAMAMAAVLLMCADYRLGFDADANIQLNETAIGLVLPYFAYPLAEARVPAHWRGRVLVNAEPLPPAAALAAGFLDETVPAARLMETARARAKALAALDQTAFLETRRRLREALMAGLAAARTRDIAEWQAMLAAAR